MPSNAKKRTLDEMADQAFEILKQHGPMRCGVLGGWLFPKATGAANCSCPYARIAGKVTKRLKEQGRAYYDKNGWVAQCRRKVNQ